MNASGEDGEEKSRLDFWERKKQFVREQLQKILDEKYDGNGTISENWVLPFYYSHPTLPNLAMTPEIPYMNLGRLVVCAKNEGYFNLYKMTYSCARYALRHSVQESCLYNDLLLVLGTFLYPEDKKENK